MRRLQIRHGRRGDRCEESRYPDSSDVPGANVAGRSRPGKTSDETASETTLVVTRPIGGRRCGCEKAYASGLRSATCRVRGTARFDRTSGFRREFVHYLVGSSVVANPGAAIASDEVGLAITGLHDAIPGSFGSGIEQVVGLSLRYRRFEIPIAVVTERMRSFYREP